MDVISAIASVLAIATADEQRSSSQLSLHKLSASQEDDTGNRIFST